MQSRREDRVVPHRKHAPAICLDRLQLFFEPGLLLVEHWAAEIAVETNDPPVPDLGTKPRPVWGARPEVVEKIIRRAMDVIVIAGDCIGPRSKLTPCRS